jgi:hypothetical protein
VSKTTKTTEPIPTLPKASDAQDNSAVSSSLPPRVLYRKHETAEWLKVSERNVQSWMKAKKIPYIKVCGTVMFNLQHVAKALERFTIQPIADKRND